MAAEEEVLSPLSWRNCGWVGGSGDAAGVVNASLAQTLAAGEHGERRAMGCISLYAAPCSGAGGARLTAWRPRRGGVDGASILTELARLVLLAVLVPQWAVGARRGPGGEHWCRESNFHAAIVKMTQCWKRKRKLAGFWEKMDVLVADSACGFRMVPIGPQG